jgi:hypothetical protein
VAKFGGQSATARLLGKRQSTVQHWVRTGTIPARWHPTLMALAAEQGIDLQPQHFVLARPAVTPGFDPRVVRVPVAQWQGELSMGIPCFVLDDGRRVISRTGATSALTGLTGQGSFESYVGVGALAGYVPDDLASEMIEFTIPEVTHRTVKGLTAESFLNICTGYVQALHDGALQTERQREIAVQAAIFLSSCSKVGLIALIDEATGYQYERAEDALRLKLKLFLEEEMRQWEKTFPDELWREFGRLTNWSGTIHKRPKYWGHLVNELVYGYLDADVFAWLKANAPQPRHGRNYHQWLSEQYGLQKLVEHIWMLVGMASTCETMSQLRRMMAERYGRQGVLFTTYIDARPSLPVPRAGVDG